MQAQAHDITVAITARDNADTIVRAVDSVLKAGYPILLLDDHSKDSTHSLGREAGAGHVTVVRPLDKLGLGNARKTALENVDTEFVVWLKATDAFIPGRMENIEWALKSGADLVFDETETCDLEGNTLSVDKIPEFLTTPLGRLLMFERNYIPNLGCPGMRTTFARQIGYNSQLAEGEDYDFILRALKAAPKIEFLKKIGYQRFVKNERFSITLTHRSEVVSQALKHHDLNQTFEDLVRLGLEERDAYWKVTYMAVSKLDFALAEEFATKAFPEDANPNEILDTSHPAPRKEGWKHAFFLGTIDLLRGGRDQKGWLAKALEYDKTPEAANNCGIAYSRQSKLADARKLFETALELFPNYSDAQINIKSLSMARKITALPFGPYHM